MLTLTSRYDISVKSQCLTKEKLHILVFDIFYKVTQRNCFINCIETKHEKIKMWKTSYFSRTISLLVFFLFLVHCKPISYMGKQNFMLPWVCNQMEWMQQWSNNKAHSLWTWLNIITHMLYMVIPCTPS